MPFSAIFDTVIGLVLVYLVLSMLNMSIVEAISSLLRLRGKVLFDEIGRILDDPEVRDQFWSSGLICSLSRADKSRKTTKNAAPSYISAKSFAAALVDALQLSGGEAAVGPDAGSTVTQPQAAATESAVASGGNRQEERCLAAMVGKIREESILRDVLTGLASGVEHSQEKFEAAIATWFDEVMERTTGVYKRYMQLISLLVAIFIACAINADTLSISNAIWQDKALQAQLVELSRKKADEGLPTTQRPGVAQAMKALTKELHPLPLGWETDSKMVLLKMVGLLLTAFAMTLGAPFWFDLLSRFVKIRSAGDVANCGGRN